MSVQFGRWNLDGEQVGLDYLDKVKSVLSAYGSDKGGCYFKDNIKILYNAFHTTKESRRESQPHILRSGVVITWDGRLDNRIQMVQESKGVLNTQSTDVELVAAAYERQGSDCFARLLGDWAMVVWDPNACSLILAKDPIGPRHLYYSVDRAQATWCTILDPLVTLASRTFVLEYEYIAGWFSSFPAAHLTPYAGIHSVPPSFFVTLRSGKCDVQRYWKFDPDKKIRYRNDEEYEEHFRNVFANAVQRRLRSDTPVIAELSGGIDSSSIVSVADAALMEGNAETPRLDTVSYYDDSEPNWDECPYFRKIEEKRGRQGCHIDIGSNRLPFFDFRHDKFLAIPAFISTRLFEASKKFGECMTANGNRVLLSGIGGDEVMGGVPTPIPELANLLATARLRTFAHQLRVWALQRRKPWLHIFLELAREFMPPSLAGSPEQKRPAQWLTSSFIRHNRLALRGYETKLKLCGPLPSFQMNLLTLAALKRQVACSALPSAPTYEKCYPFLDRDLLEFIYAIPQEQLVRPGQRRSLMRRALRGAVPEELLNRKRKAFVARAPLAALSAESESLSQLSDNLVASELGIVDAKFFATALKTASSGQEVSIVFLIRTLCIEYWLRSLLKCNLLNRTACEFAKTSFHEPISQHKPFGISDSAMLGN